MFSKTKNWALAGVIAGAGLGLVACDPEEAYHDEMQEMREDREQMREAYQEESSELRREQQHIKREIREETPRSDDSVDETAQEAIMNGPTQD